MDTEGVAIPKGPGTNSRTMTEISRFQTTLPLDLLRAFKCQ